MSLMIATVSFAQLHVGGGFYSEINVDRLSRSSSIYQRESLNGFYAGLSYNIAFPRIEGLGIAPGAYFTFARGYSDYTFMNRTALEIPIHLSYSMKLGLENAVFGYFGPAFNIGLGYKGKDYDEEDFRVSRYKTSDIHVEYDDGDLKRFNFNLSFGVGYKWRHLAFNLGCDLGLVNLNKISREGKPDDIKERYGEYYWYETPVFHTYTVHLGLSYAF